MAELSIMWLGQAGYLLEFDNIRVLIDPYLSTYIEDQTKGTPIEHVRLHLSPVALDKLGNINLILITHAHPDHFDPVTVPKLVKTNPNCKIVLPRAIFNHVLKLGLRKESLVFLSGEPSRKISYKDLEIASIPAKHEKFDKDTQLGYPYLSYIIFWKNLSFYHSGDTLSYPGLARQLAAYHIDVGFLCINGRDEQRKKFGFTGNMNYQEAGNLAKRAGMKKIIPMHYGLFSINSENVEYFANYCSAYCPDQEVIVLTPGGKTTFSFREEIE